MKFRLDLAYDGAGFHGWAAQPGQRTVESTLSEAIAAALTLIERPPSHDLVVAGRTDAGVHARAQVAQLTAEAGPADAPALQHHVARLLPVDVALHALTPAPDGFDARFSALGRTYCYRLWDADSRRDPTRRRTVATMQWPLDPKAMAEAAGALVGLRDFAAFCRAREGATTVRHLRRFDVARCPDTTIECWLEADAFCHSMVRALVGAVVAVGAGRRDLAWLTGLTQIRTRAHDVIVLPPHGLTLEAVAYPPDGQMAARAAEAKNRRVAP